MSQQANALKIGIFVVVGLLIGLGALLVLGSGRLFAHPVPVIVYFDTSVNGLAVGAPVKFKGVPVGQVKRIQIAFDEGAIRQSIPVLLELDEDRVVSATDRALDLDDWVFMQRQVDNGLRASLELDSFISGRLYVQLDYLHDVAEAAPRHRDGLYFEIPTVSTGLPEFVASLSQTDLAGLALDLRTLVRSLNGAIADFEVATIRGELVETLDSLQVLLTTPDLTNTLQALSLASEEATRFLATTQPQVAVLSSNLVAFSQASSATMEQMQRNLVQLEGVLGPDSVVLAQVQETLRDLSLAAGSVQRLAEDLERTPSALVTGRKARREPSE